METLNLSTFIKAAEDIEFSKYKVLSILRRYSEALHKNKLYPALGELISIKNELDLLLEQMSLFDPEFVLNLNFSEFSEDLSKKNTFECDIDGLNKVASFINWTMPKISEAIDEGKAIFDFVDENITISEIGVLPLYKNEGYFFIPDAKNDLLKIYRFDMSLFSTKDNPLRTLKTKLVDLMSLQSDEAQSIYDLKYNLIQKFTDLPNPACYYFNTDIDFPFGDTILPVAKRKLVRTLASA